MKLKREFPLMTRLFKTNFSVKNDYKIWLKYEEEESIYMKSSDGY